MPRNLSADVKQFGKQTLATRTSDKRVDLPSAGLSGERSHGMFGPGTLGFDPGLGLGKLDLAANANSLQQDQGARGARTTPNRVELAGLGVGTSLIRPGQWQLWAQWAHQVGNNAGRNRLTGADFGGRSGRSRAWIDLRPSF